MKSTKSYVFKAEDVPNVPHFAIIVSSSVHIPGSGEWAPGHGYPAENRTVIDYIAFTDESEFLKELHEMNAARTSGQRPFRGVKVSAPYTFETTIKAPLVPQFSGTVLTSTTEERTPLTFPRD